MKQTFRKILYLFLVLALLSPIAASIPLTVSAAGTGTFTVVTSGIQSGLGTITYTGKNYKTGATGQSQTFDLNAGFLLAESGTTHWGVCAYSGAKEPSADLNMGDLISLNANGTYIDGLNNTGSGKY